MDSTKKLLKSLAEYHAAKDAGLQDEVSYWRDQVRHHAVNVTRGS